MPKKFLAGVHVPQTVCQPVLRDSGSESLLSSAGGSLLPGTARVTGLRRALSEQLRPWRTPRARHDPGKVALDLIVAIALGGDCLADVSVLRSQTPAGTRHPAGTHDRGGRSSELTEPRECLHPATERPGRYEREVYG